MSRRDLLEQFGELAGSTYELKSQRTMYYNCAAFAIGYEQQYLWPIDKLEYMWPIEPRRWSLPGFQKAFEYFYFEKCADATFEDGFIKIAIYVDYDGLPSHVARQSKISGLWVSKIGDKEDILHELNALNGPDPAYGAAELFMRIGEDRFRALHAEFNGTRQHSESSEMPLRGDEG